MIRKSIKMAIASACLLATTLTLGQTGGFNLTEIGEFSYDADLQGEKTDLQKRIDQLEDLGVKHLILNPRALMRNPYSSELIPVTKASDRSNERRRYSRLIKYIKSKGMTVGIRPIFFVVDDNGNPFIENLGNGKTKLWWHGNIQPGDPDKWFESFRTYLDSYLLIAKATKAEEFTIGAELYSMTVGIEDQWQKHPHGFPGKWLELLRYVRKRLGNNVRIMYDINFTDDKAESANLDVSGGELERWRYRLVDLAEPSDLEQRKIWENLVSFWNELDAIGIDMYRSLASKNQNLSTDINKLQITLTDTATRYATQIDNTLAEIEFVTDQPKDIWFKEIGFRSIENGFIEPFGWDNANAALKLNIAHQAIAYEAIFQAFWGAEWQWFKGISFWDVSADGSKHGALDKGFSPLGKDLTEAVLLDWLK